MQEKAEKKEKFTFKEVDAIARSLPRRFTVEVDFGGRLNCEYQVGSLFRAIGLWFHMNLASSPLLPGFPSLVQNYAIATGLSPEEAEAKLHTLHAEAVKVYTIEFWNDFMNNLPTTLRDAIRSQFVESTARVRDALRGLIIEGPDNSIFIYPDEAKSELIKKAVLNAEKAAKRRFGVKHGGSKAKSDLSSLRGNFEKVYPSWRDAKAIYRSNRNRKGWPGMVKAAYPDLPDDLILRLGDPPNLPEDLQAKVSDTGGTSKPSEIALEHAARLCNVPPYTYTIRHLSETLRKQRKAPKSE
jgi:hypothetical protein